jgi:hypothetical protein
MAQAGQCWSYMVAKVCFFPKEYQSGPALCVPGMQLCLVPALHERSQRGSEVWLTLKKSR